MLRRLPQLGLGSENGPFEVSTCPARGSWDRCFPEKPLILVVPRPLKSQVGGLLTFEAILEIRSMNPIVVLG